MRIAKDGYPYIAVPLAAAALCFFFGALLPVLILGIVLLVLALFCIFFFRDPEYMITEGERYVLSPCNGTVMDIIETGEEKVVRVFLSIFNVHLQRAPAAGRVVSVIHQPGQFLMAWHPEAFLLNEQNIITIENEHGIFMVRQVAGFLARRCVAWIKEGDMLVKGQRIGLIKFSSQVDVHLPASVTVMVKKGDKVIAGKTIFGEYHAA